MSTSHPERKLVLFRVCLIPVKAKTSSASSVLPLIPMEYIAKESNALQQINHQVGNLSRVIVEPRSNHRWQDL